MKSTKEKIWGKKASKIEAGLNAIDEDLAKMITGFVYDDVFNREGLELKTKELLAVAHLISIGSKSELKTHIFGALNCGATVLEIKETIIHAAMFVGFPKAISAMQILKDITSKP